LHLVGYILEYSLKKIYLFGPILVNLLFENISERSVHHHLSTVESSYFGTYQEHHINKYQKCTANYESRLSCVSTAGLFLRHYMQIRNFVRIQYLYCRERTPGRNLKRKLSGSHRIGMQAAKKKRVPPLLGTESRSPDCPVRSTVSTLCYSSI